VRHDVPAAADVTPTVNGVIVDEPDPTTTAPAEKLEAIAQLRADRAVAARNALADGTAAPAYSAGSRTLSVVVQSQSTNYYCVPASSRVTISAYRSTLPSQATLAGQLGTTAAHDIAGYGYYYATKVANAYVYDPWTDSRAGRKTIGTSSLYDAMAPDGHHLVW
jgi:hypothetical protein